MRNLMYVLCILVNLFVNQDAYSEASRFIHMPASWAKFTKRHKQLAYPPLNPVSVAHNDVRSPIKKDWALQSIGFFNVANKSTVCLDTVRVAVVDTGIDYNHPELAPFLWRNIGETGPWTSQDKSNLCYDRSCNGIDDDNNGFIDDVVGWDFVHDVPLPYDQHGHGTHISGIITSTASVGLSQGSNCKRVEIMALKYYDNSGAGFNNLANTVRAISYAVKMGASIINYSGGGSDPAASEKNAIEEANKKGILFIAAAGNEGHSNDVVQYYPSSYNISNIISVASLNKNNMLLPSSNFGKNIQLAAPGLSILSTLPEGKYGTMSGTSQSTAFVTGLVAFLQSQGFASHSKYKHWVTDGASPLKGNGKSQLLSNGIISIPGTLLSKSIDLRFNSKQIDHGVGK